MNRIAYAKSRATCHVSTSKIIVTEPDIFFVVWVGFMFSGFCVYVLGDRFEWTVCSDDIYPRPHRQYNKAVRCINCREIGHRTQMCTQPRKEIKCHMCGEVGHREPRCPSTICLTVSVYIVE